MPWQLQRRGRQLPRLLLIETRRRRECGMGEEPEQRQEAHLDRPVSIPQNPDIRFLGKLLGDVIRAYSGVPLFERIEEIRSTSVDRHRGLADALALDPHLEALSIDEVLAFVRSFMLFSMLANLAEDRQALAAPWQLQCPSSPERWPPPQR